MKFYVILLGILLGISLILTPGVLFVIFCTFVIGLCIRCFTKEEDRRFILTIFITALLIRVALGTFLHFLSLYFSLGFHALSDFSSLIKDRYAACIFGDSAVTSLRAWWLSQVWHGQMSLDLLPYKGYLFRPRLYPYAIFYYFFGFRQLAGKLINSLFSTGTVIFIYYITKDIFGRRVAKLSAVLTAFFPTILLWSVTDLKEPLSCFLFCLTIFSIQRLILLKRKRYLFPLVIALASSFIRPKFGMFIFLIAFIGLLIAMSKNKFLRLAIILAVCFIVITPQGREKIKLAESKLISNISTLMIMQQGASLAGASSYKIYPENLGSVSSIKQLFSPVFITSITKGSLFFLLTPFPWRIFSKLQLLTYPQVVLWYLLLGFALLGILYSLRYYFKKSFFVLFAMFAITVLSGMSSGNVGSVVRHRDIITPLFLIFSAAGLVLLFIKEQNEHRPSMEVTAFSKNN